MEGTISTVPGAFAPRVAGAEDAARMAARMARQALEGRMGVEEDAWVREELSLALAS